MEYTKGEWKAINGLIQCKTQFGGVADIAQIIARDTRESEYANAHLIASAPDLYEACLACRQWGQDPEMRIDDIIGIIDKAIAKAEGKVNKRREK